MLACKAWDPPCLLQVILHWDISGGLMPWRTWTHSPKISFLKLFEQLERVLQPLRLNKQLLGGGELGGVPLHHILTTFLKQGENFWDTQGLPPASSLSWDKDEINLNSTTMPMELSSSQSPFYPGSPSYVSPHIPSQHLHGAVPRPRTWPSPAGLPAAWLEKSAASSEPRTHERRLYETWKLSLSQARIHWVQTMSSPN